MTKCGQNALYNAWSSGRAARRTFSSTLAARARVDHSRRHKKDLTVYLDGSVRNTRPGARDN